MVDFFVVLWVDENPQKLSVMARKDLVDGTIRLTSSVKLADTIVMFNWNRTAHRGKIIAFGRFVEIFSAEMAFFIYLFDPLSFHCRFKGQNAREIED